MTSQPGTLVTHTVHGSLTRDVSVYVPASSPQAVLFAGDGQSLAPWGATLVATSLPATMIVGVHRVVDETHRLHEYVPGFDPDRFAAHERFLVEDVRHWIKTRFAVDLPAARTAAYGVSAGGELALALGLRHPDVFGAVLCASAGAGYQPPTPMPSRLPRTYLVAGTGEPFFHDNATRWADALRAAGADVVMTEHAGGHGDPFWREELPAMVRWAFA